MKVGQLCSQHKPIVQALREIQRFEKRIRGLWARASSSGKSPAMKALDKGILERRFLLGRVSGNSYPCAACRIAEPDARYAPGRADPFHLCLRSSIQSAGSYDPEVLGENPGVGSNFEVVTL